MNEKIITCGEGAAAVTLRAFFVGEDLSVILTAGRAHVGAAALAMPCGENAEGVTASVSVLTVPGHRDNLPAQEAALRLCKVTGRPVSVTAGLHIDKAAKEEIKQLMQNADGAVAQLIDDLGGN